MVVYCLGNSLQDTGCWLLDAGSSLVRCGAWYYTLREKPDSNGFLRFASATVARHLRSRKMNKRG